MALTLVKRCPACGRESAPATLRCACGAILAGVDLSEPAVRLPEALVAATLSSEHEPAPLDAAASVTCPHADCGQRNDATRTRCLYCHRPLTEAAAPCEAWLAWPWGDKEALRGELLVGRVPPASPALIERLEREFDNVSRRHAMLRNVDGELAVEDLGSANGTYVNGVRIAAHRPLRLHPGATIRFGADLTATIAREP